MSTCFSSEESKNINNKSNDFEFWICIDLRMYGDDPSQPVYVGDTPYYFNFDQMNKIKEKWSSINPETSIGIRKHQDIEYVKAMYNDIYKKK